MVWQESSRKLRIEGGGCADMTRMLSYLTDQDPPITDVLSQVRTSGQNNANTDTRRLCFRRRVGAREMIETALRSSRNILGRVA